MRLSRLLNLDVEYFAKGSFFAFAQQLIGVSCGLVVSYLFGHFVSPTVFGQYNLVLSIIGMLTFLSLPGIDFALIKSVSSGYEASLEEAMHKKFILSLIGSVAIIGFSLYYFFDDQIAISQALIVVAIFYPFLNAFTHYPAFLTAKRLFQVLAVFGSLSSIFFLSITALSIFTAPSTLGIITGYLIAMTVPTILAYFYARRYVENSKRDPDLFTYGRFLTILSILPWISGNISGVILAGTMGVESLALYAVAGRFFTAVQKNFSVFYKPVTAKLASQSAKQHRETLIIHSLKFLAIGIFLSGILYIATPFLIRLFFTSTYEEATYYGQLLSIALIPYPLTLTTTDMLIYQKNKKSQILMSTLPHIIKILAYIVIIPTFHIMGLIVLVIIERFAEPIIPLVAVMRNKKG